jgi:hypothetical protein
MNYPRFNELFWEFSEFIENLHALYIDSIVGYEFLHEKLEHHQDQMRTILGSHEYATKEFQDTCSIAYTSLGGSEHNLVSASPVMKQGDLRRRIESNGKNSQTLANLIIVSAYSYWEEYLRIEIGKAKGALPQNATNTDSTRKILNTEVVSDFWGDIRHLRNSIIHNRGIANKEMKKCKIIVWFKPDDKISLNYNMINSIFKCMGLYRNEVHNMQFPKRYITVPSNKSGS